MRGQKLGGPVMSTSQVKAGCVGCGELGQCPSAQGLPQALQMYLFLLGGYLSGHMSVPDRGAEVKWAGESVIMAGQGSDTSGLGWAGPGRLLVTVIAEPHSGDERGSGRRGLPIHLPE